MHEQRMLSRAQWMLKPCESRRSKHCGFAPSGSSALPARVVHVVVLAATEAEVTHGQGGV